MSGQGTYRTTALVLRKTKLKETDLIVTLLREDGSIARAVAHGARKPKSPFAARLEPCAVIDALIARGRSLDVVQETRFVKSMRAVRADFDASSASLPIVEFAFRTAEEGLENPRLFQCAVAALGAMERSLEACQAEEGTPGAPAAPGAIAACRLLCAACLLKELAFAGFRPSLAHCAACGEPIAFDRATVAFDAREGGLLCDECDAALHASATPHGPARHGTRRVNAGACLLARDLLHRPFADAASLQADEAHVRDVLRLVQDLADEHVGSRLRSLSFLLATWS